MGLGEGFAPSAATSVLARLVPPTERARAVTTVWGGLDVGSAVGLLAAGPLIRLYGWPSVFYLFAVLVSGDGMDGCDERAVCDDVVWSGMFTIVRGT